MDKKTGEGLFPQAALSLQTLPGKGEVRIGRKDHTRTTWKRRAGKARGSCCCVSCLLSSEAANSMETRHRLAGMPRLQLEKGPLKPGWFSKCPFPQHTHTRTKTASPNATTVDCGPGKGPGKTSQLRPLWDIKSPRKREAHKKLWVFVI